jgi:N-acetylmuramoyl-L-alanine amidase/sugar lactone lactonase YvrE
MRKLTLFLSLVLATMLVAQPTVSIQDQKMLVTNGEHSYVLAPNGDDASYFWASVSPNGKHLVYVTARYGTFVCDINGENVRSMGRMNAPKWLDNNHVAGMQEFYKDHDEIDYVRYISRSIDGKLTRDLTQKEQTNFIQKEEARLAKEKQRQALRLAARKHAATSRTDLSGLKIYVNAGHGGYDANDRSCWTVPVPETWSNPEGYWESKSNLAKALALEEMLKQAGATVIMSRRTNNSGVRDIEYYPGATEEELAELRNGDDRDLSAIAEEANANEVDHFLSIHSNALNGRTNYLLMLYRGEDGKPTSAGSDLMAQSSGNIQILNPLTVWTSPKPLVRGDLTFYGDGWGLGVLRPLTVPGFLSEGSFHDYAPETHRLMNEDYCRLEALRIFQHFHKWFEAPLPQTATISGWVKSSNELVDVLGEPKFVYVKNSDDQWLPLNGAKVELYKGETKVAEKTTDDWYNGVFAFYDLEPGTYKLVVSKDTYASVTQEVTVAAEEIAGVKVRLKNVRKHVEDYLEPDNDAVALDKYEFELAAKANNAPNNTARALYRNDKVYVLTEGVIKECSLDFTQVKELPLPAGVVISDIGFTADDYLMAKAKDKAAFYSWDADMQNPALLFEVEGVKGNSFAVSAARWESKYYLGEGTTLYTISYDEDANKATVATSTAKEDLTNKQLTFSPTGDVCTILGASFLRYAGHAYMAKPTNNGIQFQLYDVTDGVANAKEASDPYPETTTTDAPVVHTMAWVDGYTMHVISMSEGQMIHYQTLSSAVANIYAGEVNYDGKNFIFRLNEDATDVVISLEKNNETVASQSVGALKKGVNKVANPFGTTAFDYYSITATARPVAFPVKISNDDEIFQFYAPRGVAVDRTPASPYFGRVYVTNSVAGQCEYGTAESFRNSTMGVYVLSSDFQDVTNQGPNAWHGNVEWGENITATNYQWALTRPAVAPNGDVFIPSSSYTSAGIYIMEAAQPAGDFKALFDGKRSKATGQLKSGKTVVTNPIMHCYVTGFGKDEVLYTYDRDNSMGTVYTDIKQYNIGQADSLPWKQAPTATIYKDMTESFMENGSGQLAYDQHGGFFMSQYRYNSSYAKPGLIHVNAKGEVDFNISNNGVDAIQQGGMAVNADGSLVALGTEYGTVKVWEVEYDATGAPILTEKYVIKWSDQEVVTMGMDFDAAGNLYIVSNTNERLMVYALPNTNNTYTTRVPLNRENHNRTFGGSEAKDPGEETGVRTEGLNAYSSQMSSTALEEANKAIIAYTLNAPASGLELQIIDDTKKLIATIPMNHAENRTKGAHRVEVDLNGVTPGEYNWALQVKSLPLAENEALCAVDNLPDKMLASKGLAIDNDYNSPYFGQVYVGEASGDKVLENKAIYIYDASLDLLEKVTSDKWAAAVSAPCRLTVGPDHQIYICEWADCYPNNAYIMDPANTAELTPIFGGTPAGTDNGVYLSADGKDVHGSISHIWVEGTGADRVIYTFDEDINMEGLKHPMGLFQYNIGELATPWDIEPSALVFDNADFLQQNGNSFILPDQYGWWISQDRATDNAEIPALIHINKEGKVDFNSAGTLGGRTRGALGFNKDMTMLATAITSGILLWDVKYDAAGVPTLESAGRVETAFSQSCWNVVFDVAGNIYASGAGSLCAWALPQKDYACVVAAPDTDKLTIELTDVENIVVDNPVVKVGIYTVTGQYLGLDESNLPQGLYIINGKKVIK